MTSWICLKVAKKRKRKVSNGRREQQTGVKPIVNDAASTTTVTSPCISEDRGFHMRNRPDALQQHHQPVIQEDDRKQLEILRQKNKQLQQQLIEKDDELERCRRGTRWSDGDGTTGSSFSEGSSKRIGKLQKDLKETKRCLKQSEDALQSLREQLQKCKTERNDYRDRLGQLAAIKLTDNNPNVVDISDPNRSTKLAERFSELYDNQWSDAYEETIEQRQPEDSVQHLLDVLKVIFEVCEEKSRLQLEKVEEMILSCICSETMPMQFLTHIKLYKEERKKNYKMVLPDIRHEVANALQQKLNKTDGEYLGSFVEEASDLCWLMSIQDPPMSLSFNCKKGDAFRKETLKSYTQAGKVVSFLVWPVLHQYKGGPMVSKGIAQCMKTTKRKKEKITRAERVDGSNSSISSHTLELRKQENVPGENMDRNKTIKGVQNRHSSPGRQIFSSSNVSRIANPERFKRPNTSEGRVSDEWRSLHVDARSDSFDETILYKSNEKGLYQMDVSVPGGLKMPSKFVGSLV